MLDPDLIPISKTFAKAQFSVFGEGVKDPFPSFPVKKTDP